MARQPQPAGEQRELAIDLTAAALADVAPDEVPVLGETAAEYCADPGARLGTALDLDPTDDQREDR